MRFYTLAVIWILGAILIAQILVAPPYLWQENTVSELAAQGYPRAWIMRAGFVGFGALVVLGAGSRLHQAASRHWPQAFILLYGLAVLLSGLFSTAPFLEYIPYSTEEAQMHSLLATAAGIGLSIAIVGLLFMESAARGKVFHLIALTLVIGLSAAFGAVDQGTGIIQRLLYLVGFAWLLGLDWLPLLKKNPEISGFSI